MRDREVGDDVSTGTGLERKRIGDRSGSARGDGEWERVGGGGGGEGGSGLSSGALWEQNHHKCHCRKKEYGAFDEELCVVEIPHAMYLINFLAQNPPSISISMRTTSRDSGDLN